MRRVFTKSDFKKICHVCGRNCEEDESSATIPITFAWKYEGSTVYLCGSFSQWQVKKKMHRDSEDEFFKLEVFLPPGTHEYKFIVDGVWKYDPYDSITDDGYEGRCNVIEIMPRRHHDGEEDYENQNYIDLVERQKGTPSTPFPWKMMKLVYQFPAKSVAVKGAWDNWKDIIPLTKAQNNFSGAEEFSATLKLPSGNYHFKFLVDEEWTTSATYPLAKDSTDQTNNLLVVPATFKKPHRRYTNWEEKGILQWRREEGKWTECGKLHHTFQGHSLNVVCDMVYVFGGMANNKFTNTLYMFDPRANEFSLVEEQNGDIPEPRAFHHTSVFGTKIMVYGGFNENYLNDCYVFDTAINTWAKVAIDTAYEPLPRERATVAPYAGDKLVMFGGYYCSPDMEVEKYLNDTHVLNLSLTKWVKPIITGEAPKPRSAHTADFIKGKMYVFGGMTNQQKNLNDMWMLKTSQSGPFEWKKIEPKGTPPPARHGHSSITSQSNIIYFGGKGNEQKFYADLFVFDTISEAWIYPTIEGVMPTPRFYHACVALNKGKEIAIFGGVRPKEFLNYPRMYILETESKNDENEPDRENREPIKNSC